MDRYDFNIKVERLKELVKLEDYSDALKIVDAIDWRRVQDLKLLQMVSDVYEENCEYSEAKEILSLAYEKSGLGRRFLYKLVELSLKENNVQEAESYFSEFERIAGSDSGVYILGYYIAVAKNKDIKDKIAILEKFNSVELNEKYMFELAKLYYEAGMKEKSVSLCDDIMLMFGLGEYFDKAIVLKRDKLGFDLNSYQQNMLNNKEQKKNKQLEVIEEIENEAIEDEEEYEQYEPASEYVAQNFQDNDISSEIKADIENDITDFISTEEDREVFDDIEQNLISISKDDIKENDDIEYKKDDITTASNSDDGFIFSNIKNIIYLIDDEYNIILDKTLKYLKLKYSEENEHLQIIKIKANKLNEKKLDDIFKKIDGKALMIEKAGDLKEDKFLQILASIKSFDIDYILVDNRSEIDKLKILEKKIYIEEPKDIPKSENKKEIKKTWDSGLLKADVDENYAYEKERLNIDDFASYASDYADKIDCFMSRKTMLALYEKIELMQEQNILLSRQCAEELINKAADKAEKPGFLKSIVKLIKFEKKYDKDGRLILKEEDFVL